MNIQEAKQIKIAVYLQSLGHRPVKQQGANLGTSHRWEMRARHLSRWTPWWTVGSISEWARAATSSPLRHTSTHQTACHISWTRWRSKHPMYARPTFLSLSKLPSRVLRDWRLGNSTTLHSYAIWASGILTCASPERNVWNSTSRIMARTTSHRLQEQSRAGYEVQ